MPINEAYVTLDSIIANPQDPENSEKITTFQSTPIAAVYCELTLRSLRDFLDELMRLSWSNTRDIASLNERLFFLENRVYSEIVLNPWSVAFNSLNGINIIKGIWNSALQRVEC